jgi:hypothetical protein
MDRKIVWLLVVLVMICTIGCNPVRPVMLSPIPGETPKAVKTLQVVSSTTITQENTVNIQLPSANPIVVQAMKDLARRLSVGLDKITLVRTEDVTWPDGGLGCPRPGMVYPQVLQDGMRIVLSVDGKEYHYHSGEKGTPFLCENPAPGG